MSLTNTRAFFTLILLLLTSATGSAQTDIYATYLTDSSTDFQQVFRTVNSTRTDFAFISTAVTAPLSYIRMGFPADGIAGNAVNIIVQGGAGMTLTSAILGSITVKLYNAGGTNVATATGSSQLELYQLSGGNNVYAVRLVTDPAANYTFKEVRVELSGILSGPLTEFRVYGAYYQQSCPPVLATSVFAFGTNLILTGHVDNATFAVDAPTTNFASLAVPAGVLTPAAPAFLDLGFSTAGKAGDYVGFTVAQGSATLSGGLLANITMQAYNSAGTVVATKTGFSAADLKDIGGGQYRLGFVTVAGSYNIARLRITLNGAVGSAEDINVYNGFHYRFNSAPVSIAASAALSNCDSVVLTTTDPSGGTTYLWSTGAATSSIAVHATGTYSVQVTDDEGCTRYSIGVPVTIYPPAVKPVIAGDTAQCGGSGGFLHTTTTYTSYLWSTGATTATIATSGAGLYSVTVHDANGCIARDSVSVVITGSLTVRITGDSVLCPGSGGTLSATTGFAGYLWSTGATTSSISITAPGTYSVRATDAGGCTGTDTIIVSTDLNRPLITGDSVLCGTTSGMLYATPGFTGYLWSTGATTSSITISAGGVYTVRATDGYGCTGRDTITVLINALPVTITGDSMLCAGTGGVLMVPGGYAGYLWNTGASTSSIAISSAGTYSVRVTDSHGCIGRDTITVTVSAPPAVTITGDSVLCAGTGGTLYATVGYAGYLWSTGATTSSISITAAGVYTVRVTDSHGCTGRDTITVIVSHPSVTITGDSVLCAGSAGTLSATSGFSGYLWNTGATTSSIAISSGGIYTVRAVNAYGCVARDTITVTVDNVRPVIVGDSVLCAGTGGVLHTAAAYSTYLWSTGATTSTIAITATGAYSVRVTDGNGCIGRDTIIVGTLSSKPTITGDTILCPGGTGTLYTTMPYASYVWSTGTTTASISISGPGVYTVSVTTGACSGKDTVTVTVLPQLHPTITGDTVLCPSATGVLQTTTAYSSYNWSTGATTPTATISGPGLYYVTVGAPTGCPGTDSVMVTVVPGVAPVITGDSILCSGGTGMLSVTSGYSSYHWSGGQTTSSITITTGGIYSVAVTSASGCTLTDDILVITDPVKIVVDSQVSTSCAALASGRIVVHADSGQAPYTYLWSTGAVTPVITGLTEGVYSVTATDALGCKARAAVVLTQAPAFSISLAATGVGCFGDATGSIAATVSGGSGTYRFAWSNGASASTISNLAAGQYTVIVTDNTTNCTGHDTAAISQPATAVTATAAGTDETCMRHDGSIAVSATGGTAPYSYKLNGAAVSNPANGLSSGSDTITITDANGCSTQATASIDYVCSNPVDTGEIRVHNVITSNGDGQNDVLVIDGIASHPHVSLDIFDKWGDKVYSENAYHNTWGGKDKNGRDLQSGTYYYLVKLNDSTAVSGKADFTGFIMIQR